ncbi:hypothetical protein [Mesorhizobium sp. NZP2298]|uniref:hypothetical protein n=1 Tax=Mesorhizobium sp. NZP2298 TaxID=2483403 RepID=UPI001553AAB4|nr:hypothetical protein [Mesorhizobium sp. NZP2298]QKC99226.1 hypothetical protein EB231_35150 [Mesorhizobium sp. NZP2298]
MSDEPIAWRFISNAKGAKWTVQKNFPTEVAKWPGYTVEPCYSAAALAAKDTALAEMRAELERVKKALEPFAREAEAWVGYDDTEPLTEGWGGGPATQLVVAHLRAAARAASQDEGEER